MPSDYCLQPDACIRNWLDRVNTQYDKDTPAQVKRADYDRAKKRLGLGDITNNYFFFPPQPTHSGFNIGNSRTTHNTYNTTHVYTSHADSSKSKDESTKGANKKKEEKSDWKGIAAIGIVSTAVAGLSIFVYARLSKAAEGAVNYLENTKRVQKWAQGSTVATNLHTDVSRIAQIQTQIDQRAVDKITNYKYSILTSLVGTLAMAGGGITILTSAPALATAGTIAVAAGGVLSSIAVMHAAYNCGMHWSDEEDGKREFNGVKKLIPGLIAAFTPNSQPQNRRNEPQWSFEATPPSYAESEAAARFQQEQQDIYHAIYNQRAGIYPDLPEFIPSAPSYESLSQENY